MAGALPLSMQALALGGNDFGPPGAAVVATLIGAHFCLDPPFPLPLPTTPKAEAAAAAAAAAHPGNIEATASKAGRLVAAAAKAHSQAARQEEEGAWLLGSFTVNLQAGIGLGLSSTLRVTRVDNAGPAYARDVRVGARVVSLGGKQVSALPDFVAGLQTLRQEGAQSSLVEYLQPPDIEETPALANLSSPHSDLDGQRSLSDKLPSTLDDSEILPSLLPPPPNGALDRNDSSIDTNTTTTSQEATESLPSTFSSIDSTITWMPGQFTFKVSEGAGLGLSTALRVTKVNEGSAASLAGVGIGAKLTALGGVKVATLHEFVDVLESLRSPATSSNCITPSSPQENKIDNDASEECTVDFEWPIRNLDASLAIDAKATVAGEAVTPTTALTSLAVNKSSQSVASKADSKAVPQTNHDVKPARKQSSEQLEIRALRFLPELKSLDVNRTGLGVEGACLLAAGLKAGGTRRLAR